MGDRDIDYWEIVSTKENFQKVKSSQSFWTILTLARIANALSFCNVSALEAGGGDSPSAKRARSNAFFFASSVLYEGLKVAKTLGEHFGDLKAFRDGFGTLMSERTTKVIQKEILGPMRNRFVFHFEKEEIRKALQEVSLPSYVFASGYGETRRQVYYSLADAAVFLYLYSAQERKEDFDSFTEKTIVAITDLMFKFCDASEQLISEVLNQMGWMVEERANSQEA